MNEEWKKIYSKNGKYYVDVKGRKARTRFVVFLEKNGFKCDVSKTTSRESTIDSRFPVTVDIGRKKYGHMGNTICAAAAATSKAIMSVEDFMIHYEILC